MLFDRSMSVIYIYLYSFSCNVKYFLSCNNKLLLSSNIFLKTSMKSSVLVNTNMLCA